jgi:SOS-response transcriptional repressor LexA
MNIKEKIGLRIKHERTIKGLTRKALAELTDSLKISRINNYERGERTPGPEEIKQLAKVLEVSPAFLMCLSDDKQGRLNKTPGLGALIPVLDYKQARDPELYIQQIKEEQYSEKVTLIPVSPGLTERIGANAFAMEVKDDSMAPEFRVNDVLIIDPDTNPNPGDFVVANLGTDNEVIIRKYKQLSASKTSPAFELIALNEDWASVRVEHDINCELVGSVISLNRFIKL